MRQRLSWRNSFPASTDRTMIRLLMAVAVFDASADRSRVAIPVAAATITMLAAATGLAGWMFGVEALKSIVGTVTMKGNMAVALLACGASLALKVAGSPRLKAVAVALAAFAAARSDDRLRALAAGFQNHIAK